MLDSTEQPKGDLSKENGDTVYRVSSDELRAFASRIRKVREQIADLRDDEKEIFAELKSRGYLVGPFRKVLKRMERSADDLAEEDAMIEVYTDAMRGD